MTQSERSEHQYAVRPPLRLEITLLDLPSDLERVDVDVFVGTYKTMHRSVLVSRDALGEIPLTVEADLYKWVAWLLAEQEERCIPDSKKRRQRRQQHPHWDSQASYRRPQGAH